MIEILRSNDPVELSWAQAVLAEAAIEVTLLDQFTAGIEGSIGAIPRRLVVEAAEFDRAQGILADARAELARLAHDPDD